MGDDERPGGQVVNRDRIVSIRLSDDEYLRLRRIADASSLTVSEVVREFVRDQMAPPLPRGASVGASTTHVWVTPEYRSAIGASETCSAVWSDGTVGFQYPALVTS